MTSLTSFFLKKLRGKLMFTTCSLEKSTTKLTVEVKHSVELRVQSIFLEVSLENLKTLELRKQMSWPNSNVTGISF